MDANNIDISSDLTVGNDISTSSLSVTGSSSTYTLETNNGDNSNLDNGYYQIKFDYFSGGYPHYLVTGHDSNADGNNRIYFYLNDGTAAGSLTDAKEAAYIGYNESNFGVPVYIQDNKLEGLYDGDGGILKISSDRADPDYFYQIRENANDLKLEMHSKRTNDTYKWYFRLADYDSYRLRLIPEPKVFEDNDEPTDWKQYTFNPGGQFEAERVVSNGGVFADVNIQSFSNVDSSGDIGYDTSNNRFKYHDGSGVKTIANLSDISSNETFDNLYVNVPSGDISNYSSYGFVVKNKDVLIENDSLTGGTGIARIYFGEDSDGTSGPSVLYNGDSYGGNENRIEIGDSNRMKVYNNGDVGINSFRNAPIFTGDDTNYRDDTVDQSNRTNTYFVLAENGAGNDWAYLRQIGGSNQIKLSWDIHDDNDNGEFMVRGLDSADTKSITEWLRLEKNAAYFNDIVDSEQYRQRGQYINLISHITVEAYNNGSLNITIQKDTGGIVDKSSSIINRVSNPNNWIIIYLYLNKSLDTVDYGIIKGVPEDYSFHVNKLAEEGYFKRNIEIDITPYIFNSSRIGIAIPDNFGDVLSSSSEAIVFTVDVYKYAALNSNGV
jgi:hypothetical protein